MEENGKYQFILIIDKRQKASDISQMKNVAPGRQNPDL